ncbi:hypothetical protein [Rhodococcus sp. IEGM 1318]|uniref:hypothetical protein n=1 Tax=Rhodococcus sp. IEGM 1318 TaxID=3082226 RepID=UPI0029550101|nr:hypothetical protein [Rhodococcus sp. IEGM 1318]MDV8008635.1 hypothetical protein [Rhodococcus sp. IEGM 1318]
MSGYILDTKDLDRIQPTDVEAVLRSLGWQLGGGVPNLASQWFKVDEPDEPSVLVPLNHELADYRQRMTEVVRSLYRYHSNQVDNLVLRLLIPGVDEISNHKEESTIGGSIPWVAGEKQIVGFRGVLVAAAKSAEQKERHFGNRRWKTGNRYLSQLRMGQTRVGSYVVTALSPVGPLPLTDQTQQYDANLGITGRNVVEGLVSGLESLRTSSEEYLRNQNDGVFEEAVQSGVSLDLVKAVQTNLGEADGVFTTIKWSSQIETTAKTSEVSFDKKFTNALQAASTRLTDVIKSKRVMIIGRVTGLDRDVPGEQGKVVLHVLDGADENVDYVSVTLGNDYNQAIDFHKGGQLVHVSGELNRVRRKWELTDITSFQLISSAGENLKIDISGNDERELPPS